MAGTAQVEPIPFFHDSGTGQPQTWGASAVALLLGRASLIRKQFATAPVNQESASTANTQHDDFASWSRGERLTYVASVRAANACRVLMEADFVDLDFR
jgi:hypothetical protein